MVTCGRRGVCVWCIHLFHEDRGRILWIRPIVVFFSCVSLGTVLKEMSNGWNGYVYALASEAFF